MLKKHFKLYKAGKLWLIGAIATLGIMVGGQQALADTTIAPAQQQSSTTAQVVSAAPIQQQSSATVQVVSAATSQSMAAAQPTQPVSNAALAKAPAKQTGDQGALSAVNNNGTEVTRNGKWYLQDKQGQDLNGWQKLNDNRTVYYDPSNNAMVHGEKQINSYWYHFAENNGQVSIGFTNLNDGRHVYYNEKGQMQHGFTQVPNKANNTTSTYHFAENNGDMTKGEAQLNGHWYNFGTDGKMMTGFHHIAGNRTVYYSDKENNKGQMQKGLTKVGNSTYYFALNNGDMFRGEHSINNHWYNFGTNGIMMTGFQRIAGNRTVYYDANGQMQKGLTKVGNNTYYFALNNGNMIKGEVQTNGHWYNFDNNGHMVTGFANIAGNRRVYYNANGQMQKGLTKVGNNTYYFASNNGNMIKGEVQINGHWYNFDNNGHMIVGLAHIAGNRTVYYNANGQMLHGIQQIGKNWYHFAENNGNMTRSAFIYNPAQKSLNYYNQDGVRQTGNVPVKNHVYNFMTNGALKFGQPGEVEIQGAWYLVGPNDQLLTSFQKLESRTVYYDTTTAQMVHGEKKIGNYWYYFALNNGAMATGFVRLPDGRQVYYDNQGHMYYGQLHHNGYWYYFHTNNGAMANGFTKLPDNRTVYYNNQGHMIYGWQRINGRTYFFDQNNGDMYRENHWIGGHEYYFDSQDGHQVDEFTAKTLNWFFNRMGKLTYSMYGSRTGADGTADCSGSVTMAVYNAGGIRPSIIYSTETLPSYLYRNGYRLVYANSGYNNPQVGDVVIWKRRGNSNGAYGHTGIVSGSGANATFISTSFYTEGKPGTAVQNLNYYNYWADDDHPAYYVYRR